MPSVSVGGAICAIYWLEGVLPPEEWGENPLAKVVVAIRVASVLGLLGSLGVLWLVQCTQLRIAGGALLAFSRQGRRKDGVALLGSRRRVVSKGKKNHLWDKMLRQWVLGRREGEEQPAATGSSKGHTPNKTAVRSLAGTCSTGEH